MKKGHKFTFPKRELNTVVRDPLYSERLISEIILGALFMGVTITYLIQHGSLPMATFLPGCSFLIDGIVHYRRASIIKSLIEEGTVKLSEEDKEKANKPARKRDRVFLYSGVSFLCIMLIILWVKTILN